MRERRSSTPSRKRPCRRACPAGMPRSFRSEPRRCLLDPPRAARTGAGIRRLEALAHLGTEPTDPLGIAVTVRCHISVPWTPGDNRTLSGRASPAGQGHPCREGRRLLLGPPGRTQGLAPRVRGGLDLDRTLSDRDRRARERLALDEHLAGESASGCRGLDGLAI